MLSTYWLPGKIENEKIIKVIRRDIFILFKKVLLFACLIIFPFLFFYLMLIKYPAFLVGELSYPLIVLSSSAYYIFVWLFFFFSFIDYYLDVWIITNERIIDIRQQGFFSRVISEQRLFRVQDVTSEVHGFFTTIFKYGDVYIQTAGSKQRFFFQEVPSPEEIRNIKIKLVERNKEKYQVDNQ